nr:MAG TPA: hypothetical protein [Caudoviricetes sp.]
MSYQHTKTYPTFLSDRSERRKIMFDHLKGIKIERFT